MPQKETNPAFNVVVTWHKRWILWNTKNVKIGANPASKVVVTWHKKGEKMIQTRIAGQHLPFFFHAGLP